MIWSKKHTVVKSAAKEEKQLASTKKIADLDKRLNSIFVESNVVAAATLNIANDIIERIDRGDLDRWMKRFNHASDNIRDGFIICQIGGKIISLNRAATLLLGVDRDECKLHNINEFIPDSAFHFPPDRMLDAHFETPLCTTKGIIDAEFSTSFVQEGDGRAVYIIVRDVSARKKVELETEQALQRISTAFDGLPGVGCYIRDAKNDEIIYTNEALRSMFTAADITFAGRSVAEVCRICGCSELYEKYRLVEMDIRIRASASASFEYNGKQLTVTERQIMENGHRIIVGTVIEQHHVKRK